MKTIFDKTINDELINRIGKLDENSTAQWGRMNIYQMLTHCKRWEEMILGKKKYKRLFIGRVFGKLALRNVLKDDNPLRRNSPTVRELKISKHGDVLSAKMKWIALVEEHEHFSNPKFVHPFFGKMTKEQIGYFAYKHADHHLRQFNC